MEKDYVEEFVEEEKKREFQEYVKEVTPTHNLAKQMINAFLCGGIICTIGQFILNYCTNNLQMEKESAGSWCSLILILCYQVQALPTALAFQFLLLYKFYFHRHKVHLI